jgi:hypothetical protein
MRKIIALALLALALAGGVAAFTTLNLRPAAESLQQVRDFSTTFTFAGNSIS